MQRKSLIGWLIALALFLFLILRATARTGKKEEAKTFQQTLRQTLSKSKYSGLTDYWYYVAKMETENFTSPLFLNANNPWGMRLPEKRKTTATGGYKASRSAAARASVELTEAVFVPGAFYKKMTADVVPVTWAKYPNFDAASQDIVLWMDYNSFPTAFPTLLAFIQAMKSKGYFGSESVDSYYKKVMAWKDR